MTYPISNEVCDPIPVVMRLSADAPEFLRIVLRLPAVTGVLLLLPFRVLIVLLILLVLLLLLSVLFLRGCGVRRDIVNALVGGDGMCLEECCSLFGKLELYRSTVFTVVQAKRNGNGAWLFLMLFGQSE